MLGLLAFAVAPLLLHLRRRRTTDVIPWAAFDFLADALQETRRRVRIENWLLILLRTLLIVLIVLAVADPQSNVPAPSAENEWSPRHRIFLVDVSYSMDYDIDNVSAMDRAKRLMREIVETSRPNDAFSLIAMSGQPQPILPEATRDREEILTSIDALATVGSPINVPATCNIVADLTHSSKEQSLTSIVREIIVITDLRREGWHGGADDTMPNLASDSTSSSTGTPLDTNSSSQHESSTLSALKHLSEHASITILDVGFPLASKTPSGFLDNENIEASTPQDDELIPLPLVENERLDSANLSLHNVGFDSILVGNSPLTVGQTMRVDLLVHNWGTETLSDYPVELCINGRAVAETTTAISPSETRLVVLRHRFDQPGRYLVEARLPNDALLKDNVRRLVVEVQDTLRVLLVEELDSATGGYIQTALAPLSRSRSLQGELSRINVSRIGISRWTSVDPENVDCIILCDPVRFTDNEIRLLNRYLELGQGVVFFLGPRLDLQTCTEQLFDAPLAASLPPLLPGRLSNAKTENSYRIDPIDYEHPITHVFAGNEASGLLTMPIQNYHHIEISDEVDAHRALNMGNGAPLVTTHVVKNGQVVCVATSPSPDWSSLQYWPSFLPLAHEIVRYAVLGKRSSQEYVAGDLVDVAPLNSRLWPTRVRLPNGIVSPLHHVSNDSVSASHGSSNFTFNKTDQVGIYWLESSQLDDNFTDPWSNRTDQTTRTNVGSSMNPQTLVSSDTSPVFHADSSSIDAAMSEARTPIAINPYADESDPTRLSPQDFSFSPDSRIRIVKATSPADLEQAIASMPGSTSRGASVLLVIAFALSLIEFLWARRLSGR